MFSRLLSGTALMAALALPLAAQARTVEEAKASGTIRVGIQGDNCPWGCINSAGQADGFDADMGRAFAEYLGVEAEFVPLQVANRIPALTTDKVDVLFATMGMTAERAQSIQYSRPYAANQLSVVAPKEMAAASGADLAGKRVGVPRAAAQDTALTAEAPEANILRFDDDAATIQALLSGQVDAVGGNQIYIQRLEAARPGVYENKMPLTALYNGAGSRLGETDWNEALNGFLESHMISDAYKATYDKWMQLSPPDFPAEMDGIPYTVTQ
ncbi:transporter substrate-binding domain-containing protein [Paracoccus sp. MC1862]|uniref:transporter substrate-binding domain-containing protein n=1 Tax=Paracoccus sp. MC1862 TaxID=2760307 RepID=UPI0016030E89|nr:transporter substrate-binding domain-containing protein [Paracoccus sp. MC1862]MBB1496548.1 transporter substrate-binding domain-containing protein [Paracoccus sp. MC1862]QQO43573.1 transporter substrate-binding domain-containing protein [Paracoccus sp. MC1862]